MAELFRLNTRVSIQANEWLDRESEKTGIPKSVLVMMAVEQYIQTKEAMASMADMGQVVAALERLEKKLDSENGNG